MGGGEQCRLARRRRQLGHDPSAVEHGGAVAHQRDLAQLAREHHHRGALVGEVADQVVHLVLGADVDATGRVEQQHHAQTRCEPAGDRDLLLVAAGQASHLRRGACVDGQPADRLVDTCPLRPRVDRAPAGDAVEQRGGDVLADRALGEQRMEPVGGHEHDALADHVERMAGRDHLAVDRQLAALGAAVAGEDVEEVLLALALERHDAEHLARCHGEADVLELATAADATRFEDRAVLGPRQPGPGAGLLADDGHRLAEHRRHDLGLATFPRHERGDAASVTEHRAHVAVLTHLRQAVGDEQHRAVARLPLAHHLEHPLGQVRRQRRGDLVEEQELRVERKGHGRGRACAGTAAARRAPARRSRGRRGPSRRAAGARR